MVGETEAEEEGIVGQFRFWTTLESWRGRGSKGTWQLLWTGAVGDSAPEFSFLFSFLFFLLFLSFGVRNTWCLPGIYTGLRSMHDVEFWAWVLGLTGIPRDG
jgi:hypothetical protein